MNSDLEKKICLLTSACQALGQSVRQLSYSKDSDSVLNERARKALAHLRLAHESLDARAPIDPPRQTGRVFGRLGSMIDRMAGGASARKSVDTRNKLAGSIASMRSLADSPHSATSGMRGSSATISIPEFLGLLQVQAKSGTLTVSLERESIELHIAAGDVVEAYSDNTPPGSRLGEILIDQGAIDVETLDAFFVYHTGGKTRLGRELGLRELVSENQLRFALTEQVMRMVHRLTQAENAAYVFHEGRIDESDCDYRLHVVELLLESARMMDELKEAGDAEGAPILDEQPSLLDDIDAQDGDLQLGEEIRRALWKRNS